MASLNWFLNRIKCPRKNLDQIAGGRGAGRVDVNDRAESTKGDAGVLNSHAKLGLLIRDAVHGVVSRRDGGVITNGDDENERAGDGDKVRMIIGAGFVAVKEDPDDAVELSRLPVTDAFICKPRFCCNCLNFANSCSSKRLSSWWRRSFSSPSFLSCLSISFDSLSICARSNTSTSNRFSRLRSVSASSVRARSDSSFWIPHVNIINGS